MSKLADVLKGWSNKQIARFYDSQTGEIRSHRLAPDGSEIVSDRPLAPPVGYKPPQESMFDIVRRQVADEIRRNAAASHQDTDQDHMLHADYLVSEDDDDTPLSPHEVDRLGFALDRELEAQRAARAYALEQEQKKPPSDGPPASAGKPADPPADGPAPPTPPAK